MNMGIHHESGFGRNGVRLLSRTGVLLFGVFVGSLVVPIIDVPLFGLSLSAPLLFLVSLEVFLPSRNRLPQYRRWIVICYLLLLGFLLSLVGNAVFRDTEIGSSDILSLVRHTYWIIAFLTTVLLIASIDYLLNYLSLVIAALILFLGLLRLVEAFAFGRWGAWTGVQLLTQNSYGIQFSTFFPFALALPFILRRWTRWAAIIAVIMLVVAIAGNGSRSSWIAVAASTGVFLFMFAITHHKGVFIVQSRVMVIVSLILLVALVAPHDVMEPIVSRFDTFDTLDSDKSYQIRQLMIQKGQRLFEDSPFFGSGIGRFRQASVPLDIPDILGYADQSYFDNKSAHNSYMAFIGETGLVGIIPFLLLHVLLFVRGIPAALSLARSGKTWALAVFCGYVGMSIHLWSLAGLTGTTPWFVYGLVAGMIEYEQRIRDETSQEVAIP